MTIAVYEIIDIIGIVKTSNSSKFISLHDTPSSLQGCSDSGIYPEYMR